ncbi:MAG: undecaprenyl-diphosphate phosphatase [Candidatus Riflemargulisbacteria bacterium]
MLKIAILGIVQGITEFLPISSSGHLVIGEKLLGISTPGLSLEIILHLGTLLAVLVFFHKQIWKLIDSIINFKDIEKHKDRLFSLYIIVAMIPTGIIGLLIKKTLEANKNDLSLVGTGLIFTALILFVSNIIQKRQTTEKPLTLIKSIFIGIGQGIAVIPGISRSGSTIATALMTGISRKEAAEFSFILSIPAILAATLVELDTSIMFAPEYLIGMLCSFLAGLFTIKFLIKIISQGKFHLFGYYCLIVGFLVVISC